MGASRLSNPSRLRFRFPTVHSDKIRTVDQDFSTPETSGAGGSAGKRPRAGPATAGGNIPLL
jgi:hypothetical protein